MKATLFARAGIALAGAAMLMAGAAAPSAARAGERATSLFVFDGASGYLPGAGVITDSRGTIFGTTDIGGNGPCAGGAGCGTVFALSPPPPGGGAWVFSKLYDFQGGQDGASLAAQLTLGPGGILYGYTAAGSYGTVFQLSPPSVAGNPWQFQVLYEFTGGADGDLLSVFSPLIYRRGALYGVASGGASGFGDGGCGSVFRLRPGVGGGRRPTNLILTPGGTLYGLAGIGPGQAGLVFQLAPPASGSSWTRTAIATVREHKWGPISLAEGNGGSLIGAVGGDPDFFAGAIFQLPPPIAGGAWTYSELWDFDQGPDRNPVNVVTRARRKSLRRAERRRFLERIGVRGALSALGHFVAAAPSPLRLGAKKSAEPPPP